MRKLISFLSIFALFMMFVVSTIGEAKSKFEYIGLKKCKMCHRTKKRGNQFGIWEKGKHAQAYATLGTAESKAVAKKAGVTGDPQKAKECLECHTTGYGAAAAATLTLEEGVSCEACHGPGSEYKSNKVMKGLYAGTMKAADYGLIEPTEEVCKTCHNPKSPTYKKFNYAEAVKQISHPTPKKK